NLPSRADRAARDGDAHRRSASWGRIDAERSSEFSEVRLDDRQAHPQALWVNLIAARATHEGFQYPLCDAHRHADAGVCYGHMEQRLLAASAYRCSDIDTTVVRVLDRIQREVRNDLAHTRFVDRHIGFDDVQ